MGKYITSYAAQSEYCQGYINRPKPTHNMAGKCKIGKENQIQQAAHKIWAENISSKIHGGIRMRSGQIIWKPHILSIDV